LDVKDGKNDFFRNDGEFVLNPSTRDVFFLITWLGVEGVDEEVVEKLLE
jgi:hypothetical protein